VALMFIAGEWRPGKTSEPVRHPYDQSEIDTVPVASIDDVDVALAGASEGARAWGSLDAHSRFEVLMRAADLAETNQEKLAQLIALETGKAISEASSEASRAGELIRLAAFEGSQLYGHSLPLDAHPGAGKSKLGFTLRQPCGVVVAITPFNYPLLLVLHKLAPALAAGNAVVLKPARATPLVALELTKLFLEAGVVPTALSCITGPGVELGQALCGDPRVRKISFTGSSATGEAISRVAGVKKLSLELGASCPVAVLDDADLDLAIQAISVGGYVNAGQVCISVQRVLADRSLYGDLLDGLASEVRKIRTGNPLDPSTTMGTLINEVEAARVERTIREGVSNGARLICGGEREGAVMSPAVVADVDPRSPLSQEELFGPAVAVSPVDDIEAAIAWANSTRYGLGAGVFTRDVSKALRFVREVEAGNVHVNWTPLWRADLMPYGGLKGSGIGKEGPRWAVEEMTELKTVVLHGQG
jgi:acyl-CoA reductase-like NAD-dependent aldehyde dehydrogenase